MNSGKKMMALFLALAVVAAIGCSRKQQAPVYSGGVVPVSQPQVNAAVPASSGTRSSSYIK